MKEFTIEQSSDLKKVIHEILKELKYPCLILLDGELGSGKTTFVQSFVKEIGLNDSVTSPTFTKIHEYIGESCTIYHLDLYRILPTDWEIEEILNDQKAIILIEWASKLKDDINLLNSIEGSTNLQIWQINIEFNEKALTRKLQLISVRA